MSVVSSRRSSCARLPQLSEARALPRAQLRRRPALDHLALVDDDNIVGAHDGLEAMGDREDGGAVDGREGALDERVRLEVDLCRVGLGLGLSEKLVSTVRVCQSVPTLTEAVASSSTRMRARRSSARLRQSSWRCPIDRLAPRSSMGQSSASACEVATPSMPHARRLAHISPSVRASKGSRL